MSKRNALHLIAPPELTGAIRQAADRELTTASAWTRAALLKQLRAVGIDPGGPASPRPAGEVADSAISRILAAVAGEGVGAQ